MKNILTKGLMVTVIVLFAATALLLFYYKYESLHFVCSHPEYRLITNGFNRKRIVNVLGEPDKKIIKQKCTDYIFAQGELESRIKEGWIYKLFGWSGIIEVYFNEHGIVIGKNCGDG